MPFVTARCPQCGGELKLDDEKATAFCMHCGTKIIVQEAINAVRIDNTHMIENWMKLGEMAIEGGNYSEAYDFFTKIVEVQPDNWFAIYKRSKAAGWQSTLINPRLVEATTGFGQAINLAPDSEKQKIKFLVNEEVRKLAVALVSLRADRFIKWPDKEEALGFLSDISNILEAANKLDKKSGFVASGFMKPIAKKINTSVMNAFSRKIKPEYVGDNNKPDKYDFDKFNERILFCTTLVEKAIGLSDEDDKEDIQAYRNLIKLNNEAINSCSWEYAGETWMGVDYKKGYELTKNAKLSRKNQNLKYKSKIKEIERKVKKKKEIRILQRNRWQIVYLLNERLESLKTKEEYWSNHLMEKKRLISEREKLYQEKNNIEIERESLLTPLIKEKEENKSKITQFESEIKLLGLFKGKEKKAIQAEIEKLQEKNKELTNKQEDSKALYDKKVFEINNKIIDIENKLNRPR